MLHGTITKTAQARVPVLLSAAMRERGVPDLDVPGRRLFQSLEGSEF